MQTLNEVAQWLAAKALKYPGATQRQDPFIAVSGTVPPHKDLNEPKFLALLVLKTGDAIINSIPKGPHAVKEGELIVLNLHELHSLITGPTGVFVAMYGAGGTAEVAERALDWNRTVTLGVHLP